MILGSRVEGRRIPMPYSYVGNNESVVGNKYEIVVKLKDKLDDRKARELAYKLADGLLKKFNAKLLYFSNNDDYVTMDIEGSPFVWSELIMWLPEIFMSVGAVILLVSVFLIVQSKPLLSLGVIAGVMLLAFGYNLYEKKKKIKRRIKIPVM